MSRTTATATTRLFPRVQIAKCWQFFLELNSKRLYESPEKEKKVVALCSRPPQTVKIGISMS